LKREPSQGTIPQGYFARNNLEQGAMSFLIYLLHVVGELELT
jgi:hypothetical protein